MDIALSMDPATVAAFERLDRVLGAYAEARASKQTTGEVLFKKGRDLSIAIAKGFRAHQYAKPGERGSGGANGKAFADAALRARRMVGTFVRPELRLSLKGAPETGRKGQPLTPWQRAVAAELLSRQRGSGVLAAPFSVRGWKKPQDGATGIERTSKSLGAIGVMVMRDNTLRLTGSVAGQALVDTHYSVVRNAVTAVTADMGKYLENLERKRLREAGLSK